MVVFDAGYLLFLFSSRDVGVPRDPATDKPVERARERIEFLLRELQRQKTKIIIPTPALSEILVSAGKAGSAYLAKINASAAFRVEPFDERAAIEVAMMTRGALDSRDKRGGGEGVHAKIKYDRQIVAIAKVTGATAIYSDDRNIGTYGAQLNIPVISLAQLPLPPDPKPQQPDMFKNTAELANVAVVRSPEPTQGAAGAPEVNAEAEPDATEKADPNDRAPEGSSEGSQDGS